jgi:hypothetical protein
MAWAKNGTPDTLGGTADTMTISDLTASKFNIFMTHVLATAAAVPAIRLGSTSIDTGTNYARRVSLNGGTDATSTSVTEIHTTAYSADSFVVGYIINIAAEEKLVIAFKTSQGATGAATASNRMEVTGKWDNTSNQFDNIQMYNDSAGDYLASSNLSALGSEGVESMTVQDGAVYYETDTNKSYVLYNNTWTEV